MEAPMDQTEKVEESGSRVIIKKKKKLPPWVTRSMAEAISREQVLLSTIKEVVIFVIFFALVTTATIESKDYSTYYLTNALQSQFDSKSFHTIHDLMIPFDNVTKVTDFWHFLDVFVNVIYVDYYYDNFKRIKETIEDDKKILFENKLLGVARIRQARVRNDSCVIHPNFQGWFKSCYGSYHSDIIDKAPYGPGNGTAWTYQSVEVTGSESYPGRIATYDGGGYYQDLATNKEEALAIIYNLKNNLWITRNTRVVFIDFAVYNANRNLFCICKLVFEFPPTGGIIPSMQFFTLDFLHILTDWDYFIYICEILYYLIAFFYVAEEIRELIFFKWDYFFQFWTYIDVSIIGLSMYSLVLYLSVFYGVEDAVQWVIAHPEQYGNLEHYCAIRNTNNNIDAILFFLTVTKIFKYINFNLTMGQLNNTLRRCGVDLIVFFFMFFIIFIAFAVLGYLLFGTQVGDFRSFPISMFSLFRMILGDIAYDKMEKCGTVLATVYFLSYIIFVFFILLNMFLAIINDTYADVKTEITVAPEEVSLIEILKFKISNMMHKYGHHFKWITAKGDRNITIERIKAVLKRCGYNALQIEMCFARYGIDSRSKDFQRVEGTDKREINPHDHSVVQLLDYVTLQERLVQVEKIMEALHVTVGLLSRKVDAFER